jgi:hypothetical protein
MANEKVTSDDVLTSIARTVGTTAGIVVSTATRLAAKASQASKATKAQGVAKKVSAKKKAKPAAKRKAAVMKKK